MMLIKKILSNFFRLIPVFLIIFFILGCASNRGIETKTFCDNIVFNKIAVVPFQKVTSDDPSSEVVNCPLCGTVYKTCTYSGNPEKTIEQTFIKILSEKFKPCNQVILVPPNKVEGIYNRISANSFNASPQKILQEVGKELGVDGIVIGYLLCFKERKGYQYSAEQPASITFNVYLLRVKDGMLVWRGLVDKTQDTLMENILNLSSFIQKGGKWVTADKLAEEGIAEILKTFPGLN